MACFLLAAVAVAIDGFFSAQDGYLSKPPDYDGVSYLVYARAPYLLFRALHIRTGLHLLLTDISPLWVSALTAQQLILGDGTWQAFSVRFWPVALLLTLIYWIVSRRATRPLAVTAVVLTALLPFVSAGVRASSLEFLSGQANYYEHWYLDDLRPDLIAIVLAMWSIAVLAEFSQTPRRSAYLVSAAFAAAAVLVKTSTVPVVLAAWALALGVNWLWNRRSQEATRMSLVAALFLTVLLIPWAVFGAGILTVVTYLKEVVAFHDAYASPGGLIGGFTYFPIRVPTQLGQIEVWVVIAGALVVMVALLRRRLGPAEMIYGALVPLFYIAFSISPGKDAQVAGWMSLSIWLFFWAGVSRLAAARWPGPIKRASPVLLGAVAAYTLAVYALGGIALINWPLSEQRSNAQLSTVTADVARELGRHISVEQCFGQVPGPGWPNALIYLLMDANGNMPGSTATDVDPTKTTVSDYVASATKCTAVLAYREDAATVARAFFEPPVRQPYLQGVANWVRTPASGFVLDRTWRFNDLAPFGPHPLGHYQGVSLTLDLYIRMSGT